MCLGGRGTVYICVADCTSNSGEERVQSCLSSSICEHQWQKSRCEKCGRQQHLQTPVGEEWQMLRAVPKIPQGIWSPHMRRPKLSSVQIWSILFSNQTRTFKFESSLFFLTMVWSYFRDPIWYSSQGVDII